VCESVGIFLDMRQFLKFHLKWYQAEERRKHEDNCFRKI